ncbi:MAG: ABC transporter permease [Acidobacteriota bacterium]
MGLLVRDVRHAFRLLVRNPGFTATALLSLSLGIGATSALFSTFNSLLWRPLPANDPEQIVVLYSRIEGQAFSEGFSYPEYRDYRAQTTAFSGLAAFAPVSLGIATDDGDATRAFGEAVTADYFDLLGVRPVLGRVFLPDEGRQGSAAPVAILNHSYWERRFGSDPSIVGRTITLNGHAFTVVGVAPPGFNGTYAIYFAPNLWIPIATLPQIRTTGGQYLEDRNARGVRLLGRLKPDVDLAAVQAEVSTVASRLAQAYPDTTKDRAVVVYRELDTRPEVEISRATNIVALIFIGLTALVLLIACANVANLLLARSAARRREIAIRLALGAQRGHLVRQLLTESLLLALAAGTLGLAVGWVATRLLQSIRVPTDIPLNLEIHLDPRVVLYTLAVSLVASLAFGLIPALQASRPDLIPAIKGGDALATRGRRWFTLRNALVVSQIGVSLILLVTAGLFLRSVSGARTIDPGFHLENRALLSFDPGLIGYDRDRTDTFYRLLRDRLKQTPGVEAVTFAAYVPLDFSSSSENVIIEGRPAEPGKETVQLMSSVVDADYFATMGTSVVAGRAFTDRDGADATAVVIVNETMARTYWPGQDPIGRRLRFSGPNEPLRRVVGVAADGKYRQLSESPRPYLFVPSSQRYRSERTLVVKAPDLAASLASVRREVRTLDPAMPILDVKTMDQHMERAYLGPRLSAMLIGPAALLALVIAAVGLYGVMAYSVSRRTRELGIRMALGANPRDIVGLVMRQGLLLTGVGVGVGLLGAAAAARLVANLLFGVTPADPLTFALVPLVLLAFAALATFVPARRALRVDPLVAVKAE